MGVRTLLTRHASAGAGDGPTSGSDSDGTRAEWEIVTIAENGESKSVLQPDPELYPDLVAAGSLAAAVILAAEHAGLDLDVRSPVEGRERLICASILTPRGRFGINIGAVERWFITSLWSRGVELTRGSTKYLGDVVSAATRWACGASLSELCTAWPHLHLWELAQAHERGDAVAFQWQQLRQHESASVRLLVEAAHAQPRLRMLFPFTSHHDLHFSRCTGFPYSWDLPFIQHLPGSRYLVPGPLRGTVIGEADDPAGAVALVLAGLPFGCRRTASTSGHASPPSPAPIRGTASLARPRRSASASAARMLVSMARRVADGRGTD